eukprot:2235141-Pyramimonas_sp.AAC.1
MNPLICKLLVPHRSIHVSVKSADSPLNRSSQRYRRAIFLESGSEGTTMMSSTSAEKGMADWWRGGRGIQEKRLALARQIVSWTLDKSPNSRRSMAIRVLESAGDALSAVVVFLFRTVVSPMIPRL